MSESKPRRRFLIDASYIAAAATGIAAFANRASGEEGQDETAANESGVDVVQPIDLGLTPQLGSHELVVLPKDKLVFASFPATGDSGDGVALVEFSGCKKWRLCGGAVSDLEYSAVDTDSLDFCGTFEVLNSSWAQLVAGNPEPGEAAPLRHFVFTFFGLHPEIENRGRNLECLAETLHAELLPPQNFGDVVEYVNLMESEG